MTYSSNAASKAPGLPKTSKQSLQGARLTEPTLRLSAAKGKEELQAVRLAAVPEAVAAGLGLGRGPPDQPGLKRFTFL